MNILGNLSRGLLFIISAPAGTGKTTLVRMLTKEFSCVKESISYTTREPRPGEQNGVDYHFITKQAFQEKIRMRDFLEHAEVFGAFYGTSSKDVEKELSQGRHVVLVIDTQGAMQLKALCKAIFIFISPPSFLELKNRLTQRKTDSEASMERRLSQAEHEMAYARSYDYHLINTSVQMAYEVLRSILIAEEHKNRLE